MHRDGPEGGPARPATEGSGQRQRPVIVAVIPVRMVQVIPDEMVDMMAMRHGLVTAGWTVLVRRIVTSAAVLRRATLGIFRAYPDDVLVDMVAVRMMQMPIMQVVDVTVVADGGVTASATVLMRVPGVSRMGDRRHEWPILMLSHSRNAAAKSFATARSAEDARLSSEQASSCARRSSVDRHSSYVDGQTKAIMPLLTKCQSLRLRMRRAASGRSHRPNFATELSLRPRCSAA